MADDPLAGQDLATIDRGETPAPDYGGPSAVDVAGLVANGANAAATANPNPGGPGAWARNLLAGVNDALAGAGAGGRVPPGAGALWGLGAGARAVQERNDQKAAIQRQQQQQAFENQQKTQNMTREDAIARATIAHENAATAHDQMLMSQLDYENRQKNIANGKLGIAPYVEAGGEILQEGIDSDEAQELIRTKKLDPTQVHAFATGEKPVLDANGNEQTDRAGNPLTRPTYTVVGDVPRVTLTADQTKFISDNTVYKFPEGTSMSGILYGTVYQQATSAATAKASIDEARAEAGLKALDTQIKTDAAKMLPDWNAALAKTQNDPSKALEYMETDPVMKQKYPEAATLIQSLYGGPKAWQDMKDKQVEEQQKQQELDQKKKEAETDFSGNPNATDPVAFRNSLDPTARGVVDMIGQGRAPLNNPAYLLARKPEIMNAVEKAYPGFDASKVTSYQKAYQNYTSGDVSKQLTSGGTAFEHLAELQQLNTLKSRIPGTADYQAYQDKVATVAAELARFYGNTTEEGIKSYLNPLNATFNRDSAIRTQAQSMGDRLDNLETEWKNAAPSPAYQAPMPGISQAAKDSRAKLDPEYAAKLTQQQPVTIYASAPGKPRLMSTDNGKTWQTAPTQ